MTQHVRVSEILSWLFPYKDIDQEVLEAKAKIGTNVHKAIVDDCNGDFYSFETDRAKAYFESYKMLYPKSPPIRQVPRLYCDKLMITGECDGLYRQYSHPEKYTAERLIDWKCSANANEDQWNMQAHFYWYLLDINRFHVDETMVWIQLRHRKRIKYHKSGNNELIYDPLEPKVYTFEFDQKVLDKCIEAAIRYHEEKLNAKVFA